MGVCSKQTFASNTKEQPMTLKTLQRQIAVALVATSVATLSIGTAAAQRGGSFDLVNRPATPLNSSPFACWTDEGYGRFTSCGQGE